MSRQSDLDNHANQMNPNNDEYWHSRGYDDRPEDWEDVDDEEGGPGDQNSAQTQSQSKK